MWTPPHARPLLGLSQTGDLGPFTIYTSKRRKPVWFTKSPPTKPPSRLQSHQRNLFRMAAKAWQQQSPSTRAKWMLAARRAKLYVNGYTLFVYYQLKRDRPAIATIERLTNLQLLPT